MTAVSELIGQKTDPFDYLLTADLHSTPYFRQAC